MTDTTLATCSDRMGGGSPARSLPPPSPPASKPQRRASAPDVHAPTPGPGEAICSQKVFKKSSPNNKLTLYLSSRDIVVSEKRVDKLRGVLLVDPEYVRDHKVFGQVTLTFRYGREDEEVMGLRFCNEAVMSLTRLYPPSETPDQDISPLQDALVRRLGSNAFPFALEVTPLAPPSVQLVPAKEYRGAPIGTSYDVRAFVADRAEEKPSRRATVRMGIRVLQRCPCQESRLPRARGSPARAAVERPFLLSEGRVRLEAALDRASYRQGEPIHVRVTIHNRSAKSVRRIKILVVQHVDVCMFSNGKFKNVVAAINSRQDCPVAPGTSVRQAYALYPTKGATKNWIALEDSYTHSSEGSGSLAATVTRGDATNLSSLPERNVFAIYVTYYVKVKLIVGAMGSEVSVKLPFDLLPSEENEITDINECEPPKRSTSDQGEVKVEVNGERNTSPGTSADEQRPKKINATAVCPDTIEPEETQC